MQEQNSFQHGIKLNETNSKSTDGGLEAVNFLPAERFSIAPMVDVTDSVFRRMARIFTKRSMLYTEMIAADAIVHEKYHLIDFDEIEHPLCLQLGSNDPKKLAFCSEYALKRGYDALNLNAGCPSDKVQCGSFGAILMKTPKLIAECYQSMQEAADKFAPAGKHVPVSVKTRIGVDELDSPEFTLELIGTIYEAGCRHIIVHARKAWLTGLSPKENRTVPPLDYERVYDLKRHFPDLHITINGGITTFEAIAEQLSKVDGVMLGRAVMDNPYLLAQVDNLVFCEQKKVLSREEILQEVVLLAEQMVKEGKSVHYLYRHVINLFNGCANSRLFRRYLSENMNKKDCPPQVILHAYDAMQRGSLI